MKDAIGSVRALDQRLRIVLERIRRGLSAAICDLQLQPLLINLKIRACALPMDAARNHLSGNAQPLGMGLAAHPLQLLDGDVIALAILNPGERQVGKSSYDHSYGDAKTKISTGGGHGSSVFRALCWVKGRSFKLRVSSFKFLVSSCEFRVPSCEVSRFRFQVEVSSFRFRVSAFEFQVSSSSVER